MDTRDTGSIGTGNVVHRHHDETRHHFSEILDEIRNGMVEMGSLVVENARRASVALVENRLEMVQGIIDGDKEVNQRYAELERLTFETLARQQPVAKDLRFLVSSTRILYELERTGDLVVNIAYIVNDLHGLPASAQLRSLVERMAAASCDLFATAITALGDLDEVVGRRLDADDDVVDELVEAFYEQIGKEREVIGLEAGIALNRLGRFWERIGDHAVNIGENTVYIVTAEFPGDTHLALRDED
ncbi:MAG: phosphate signaling complex protein PhoU [Acidimicrobiia bacterium]|nr:phosphate signaling complex protein PhoU [Acidimicrobiia bacterium]